jgi:protein-S-isoprenylcysteine O-methyltransferase Ste14
MVAQHWLIALLGLVCLPLVYLDTLKADQDGLEKFGAAYREYMARVPRVNFLAGIFRLLVRGRG